VLHVERSVFPLSPTRFGWFYLLFCVLMLIGCINYQLSLGYFFSFWLFALWPVAAVQAWRGVAGLRITVKAASNVFVGEQAQFIVLLDNPSGLTRFALRVSGGGATAIGDASAQSSSNIALLLPATRRGPMELQQLQVLARDPLGLFQAQQRAKTKASLLVYPQPESAAPPLPTSLLDASEGQAKQAGEDFAGLRAYAPGDSLRRVAWRQAARSGALAGDGGESLGGALLVKSFDAPVASHINLRLDDTPSSLMPEERLSRMCAWVLEAEKHNLPYGFTLPNLQLAAAVGEKQSTQALTALALVDL
jgi:uncharacterized protein (DUF58 family)